MMRDTRDVLHGLDEAEPPDVWRSVTSRAVERATDLDETPGRGRRATVVAVAAVLSVVTVAVVIVAFATTEQAVPSSPTRGPTPGPPVGSFDGWNISVSINPDRLGPLAFAVGPIEVAGPNGWVKHRFTITNVGDRPLVLGDGRTSTFLGPPPRSLIAADEGCGYSRDDPSGRVHVGACLLYRDVVTLRPGRSRTRDITLTKDLPGMKPLVAGTYVFDQPVAYQVARGDEATRVVHITYEVTPSCPAVRADLLVDRTSGPPGSDIAVSGPISYLTESGEVKVDPDEQFQVWWNVEADRYAGVSADAIRAAKGEPMAPRSDGAFLIGTAQPRGSCSFSAVASIPQVPLGEYPVSVLRVGGSDGSTTAYGSFTMRVDP